MVNDMTARKRAHLTRWATEQKMLLCADGDATSVFLNVRRSLTARERGTLRSYLGTVDGDTDYSNVQLHTWGPTPVACRVKRVAA